MAASVKVPRPTALVVRWVLAVIGVVLVSSAVAQSVCRSKARDRPVTSTLAAPNAEARCDDALTLVTAQVRWPVVCRPRAPGDTLQGQAYPPPKGLPPFDDPRIEIYVGPSQSRASLAHAIAHELGHMHHTRDPRFVPEWLEARKLPPDTRDDVWTEDYAEVFAALFGPPVDTWQASTTRPDAATLAALKGRFFADA